MRLRWTVPLFYISFWQLIYYFKFSAWFVLIGTTPFLLLYYKKFLGDHRWYYSLALFALFAFLLVMPAILSRTLSLIFNRTAFFNSVVYSFLFALTAVPIIFSTFVEVRGKKMFYGMLSSGVAYFLTLTPVFVHYTLIEVAKILLYQLSFDVALSIYLSYYYLSENKKLLGPFIFFFLYSAFSFLGLAEKVSPLFNIVWEIISISILFWITYFALGENVWVKKLLKSKKRIHIKRKRKLSDIAFAIVMVFIATGAIGGYATHTIAADPTPSMYPVIVPGSLLIIKPSPAQAIKTGEIIEFHAPWANGTLYAHEVVQIKVINNSIYFRTRGINNPVDDPGLVPASDLVGIVVYHVPYLGYPLIYGRVTAALLMVIIIGSVVIEGSGGKRRR